MADISIGEKKVVLSKKLVKKIGNICFAVKSVMNVFQNSFAHTVCI